MGKKVLIVGGVAGGASAAARLRRLDENAEIILFERGEYISYANCGLPYHVGGAIPKREALLLQTPQVMRSRFNIDVRVCSEVVSIDREARMVTVENRAAGERYTESYDTLILSTGSEPLRPPIPGIDSDRIRTLWTVPDTDEIKAFIAKRGVKSAAVVGGGFIGLEMAENLRRLGLSVTMIEMLDQVMAPLDYEMALMLHKHLEQQGVSLRLGDGVDAFEHTDETVTVRLKSGRTVTADLVILSIGVRPNSKLAKDAGLELNARGGIVTDQFLRTSDPAIYAVGDAIEVQDFISGERTMIPLAGPANKQGRIAADNIAGAQQSYDGTQGTSVAKIFELTAASTGANEKTLIRRGMKKGADYESILIVQNSHAAYYPGAAPLVLKLLFSMDGKRLFGAQIVGTDGVDKRIDVLAAAIRLGAGVSDLTKLELAYAPPYSSAKDPVNMVGYVAENLLTGKAAFSSWDALDKRDGAVVLDVRETMERQAFELPDSVHIPLGQLRERIGELDPARRYIILCAVGVRAYNASRILSAHGFKNVLVYPGGTHFYRSTHFPLF